MEIRSDQITPQPVTFQFLEDGLAQEIDETFSLVLTSARSISDATVMTRLLGTIKDSDGKVIAIIVIVIIKLLWQSNKKDTSYCELI